MDILKNKNFIHDLCLNEYNSKFTSIEFIEYLRKDYTIYTQHWLNDYLKNENILDDKDRDIYLSKRPNINKYRMFPRLNKRVEKRVSFKPEFLLNRSPLTIIDGPWGSGKTHFLNETFSLIKSNQIDIDKDIKLEVDLLGKLKYEINCMKIHRFVSIDAWKYSATNNIITDFLTELSAELSIFSKFSFTTKKIKKLLLSLFNDVLLSWINRIFKVNFKSFVCKDKSIDKLNMCINKTTLIVVDNIERLGKNAWEIIRVIQRLSVLKNLIFVLPMNLTKFNELCQIFSESKNNSNEDQNCEWSIYKFINMPYYKLNQDYKGLFLNLGFSEDHSFILNKVFKGKSLSAKNYHPVGEIGNYYPTSENSSYSIREIKSIFRNQDVTKLKSLNMLELLSFIENKELCKSVNGSSTIINEYIKEEIDKYDQLIKKIIEKYNNLPINNRELYDFDIFYIDYKKLHPRFRCINEDFLRIVYFNFKNKMEATSDAYLKNLLKNYIIEIEKYIKEINENEILKIINDAEINTLNEYFQKIKSLKPQRVYPYFIMEEEQKFYTNWNDYVVSNIFKMFI